MTAITLEPALLTRLEEVAEYLGQPTTALVQEAVSVHLHRLETQKLDAETLAFEAMHPDLKRTHLKHYVAIHAGSLVDTDPDFEALFRRVRERFGTIVVLIRKVEETLDDDLVSFSLRWEESS
jgi:predicted DNA-binding protein